MLSYEGIVIYSSWELAQSGKSGSLINCVSRVQISYSQLQQNIVIKFMKRRVTNMKSFTYKKTEITSMKLSGIIDTDTMTISVDETEKSLSTLLSNFNGAYIDSLSRRRTKKNWKNQYLMINRTTRILLIQLNKNHCGEECVWYAPTATMQWRTLMS